MAPSAPSQCPHRHTCELYGRFVSQIVLQIWKIKYCEGPRYDTCVRYQKTSKGERVPLTLLPNGEMLELP